ncbi:hypothetical protein [Mycobacterium kyorinense]|uniref:Low molecular weight antigen MTB12-like C-terminal domain-containing protein n=1 Tax=Mycobacterium kyorinense TaxID=487514 RepID=A0A1X1Y9R2_9MYCO|nr:hypothetical protein AWC14_24205 [Mycobacterium kyorinense]
MVAALGLPGCSSGGSGSPAPSTSSSSEAAPATTAAPQSAPVPAPEALTDVLYRLADPAVPGVEKLNLVEGATPDNAAALDKFANALLNGGYAPMTFEARDIAWSDRDPADVVATVDVSTPRRGVPGFSFPMEFKPYQGGWQLSQRTAETLLAFGAAPPGAPPTPTP